MVVLLVVPSTRTASPVLTTPGNPSRSASDATSSNVPRLVGVPNNAIDSMEGAPRRELTIATGMAEPDMVRVSIADTGCGVSPEVADRLFQPFITTKPQGMGVGLSISRTIIEAHGGRLWVEDNPGGGAIFKFTLRVANRDEVDDVE